jgi:F-box/leucine-rich repeat protein 2/20
MRISNAFLRSIAMEVLPLRRLVLQDCTGYNFKGIFSLLFKCQLIQHLDLQNANLMTDRHVATMSLLLGYLVSINLNKCRKLTSSALLSLVSNCPSLTDIKMEHTSIGKDIVANNSTNYVIDFGLTPQLKSLYLAHNSSLQDENLILFATILPNLQLLDLSDCNGISEEGICQVLKRCCKIRHLNLAKCNVARLLGFNFEVSNLEVLNLSDTNLTDETLYVISKNCPGLLQMILEKCSVVTMKGVKHVVKNCTQLREINLRGCDKVHLHANSVSLMVFSRPSLRKITAPPSFELSEKKKLLSHQLCIVW